MGAIGGTTARKRRIKQRLFDAQRGLCFYCRVEMRMDGPSPTTGRIGPREATFDHIKPKAMGGTSALSNLVLCCCRCNNERGHTKNALTFAATALQERLSPAPSVQKSSRNG